MTSRAQIVATIGPASEKPGVLELMVKNQMDVARLNFAWLDRAAGERQINLARAAAKGAGRVIPIIADLPGPRVQLEHGHTYDATQPFTITPEGIMALELCKEYNVEYVALSFVGSAADIQAGRDAIKKTDGSQKIIAKIERKVAVERCDEIIAASDGIMVARGDLGQEVPLEEIPFIQKMLIEKANAAGKPVIVATQMMLSMTDHTEPTRAEVTDVEEAVTQGADAVMLSEESASGKYAAEAVAMMERILVAAEAHRGERVIRSMILPGKLLIARHHESEWNKQGMWTGTRDVHLTPYGFQKSNEMGELIRDIRIDQAYASMQVRAIETLSCILNTLELYHVPAEYVHALNERDYGEYTGKNKWEMEKKIGEEAFESMRRDWDYPVPNGESLKMVYERVVPFYSTVVLPLLKAGRNVLVVSHGNALRALMMYLESTPPEKAREMEMLFGAIVIYHINEEGKMSSKEVRQVDSKVNA